MAPISTLSHQIWDMKYRLKSDSGAPRDMSVGQTWARVARALAAPEAEAAKWEPVFAEAMEDFKFIPAGRILAGAGTKRAVTLFNCFVMGTVPDDMGGIFEALQEAALTLQQGGGIGYDFSTLRPKGAQVKGVGADASGPLSFMDVWDAMCRTIMSAGTRRGAMMATLACDHPDIEDFIEAKWQPDRLRMFNLSVLVTDAFIQAVREDGSWDLSFEGTRHRTVSARALWDKIMRATYAMAEPGVIFIDRINRANNLWYCEDIHCTNPCVAGDTWIQTGAGPRQAHALVGRATTLLANGRAHASDERGFFATGTKPLLRISLREGWSLRVTADHLIKRATRISQAKTQTEWVPAGDLTCGDRLVLHDHGDRATWPGRHSRGEGYLIGLLFGDGTIKKDKAVISAWPGRAVVNGGVERPGVLAIMERALAAARSLPHRRDFQGWIDVPGRGEHRLVLGAVKRIAGELGLRPGGKTITPEIEQASSTFYQGFLGGLFDADGSVQGTQSKGVSVRLAQSDLSVLQGVQRMLLRLGICSRLYRERRPAGPRALPDGQGGRKIYACAADHELAISNDSLARFAARIGFTDSDKAARLKTLLGSYRRTPNRERFEATIETIAPDGTETVYDVAVPGINAFDANGLYVHNCGEQPLPPYGACLLGSINLASLVRAPFEAGAELDLPALEKLVPVAVRMLDNAIDASRFPLAQQTAEAKAKRRIGLGITGLADALIMCGARYGSAQAVELTENWMSKLRRAAYQASCDLAQEKGAFPLFDKKKFLQGETVKALDEPSRAAIAKHGLRNALVTSVAPTGTISLFADNISSGLEPVFAFTYTRQITLADGSRKGEEVSDYAYRLFRRLKGGDAPLPAAFVDAQSLEPAAHVVMQAAVQKYIDASVSKTINLPEDIPFDAFADVYMQAYDLGCKGCTTYRPNEVSGAVLESKPSAAENADTKPVRQSTEDSGGVVYMTQPLDRPETLPGRTYKLRWPESEHAIYVTLNDIVQDGRRRPFEIFINSKNMEHYSWTVALTRMISAVFRRGGDVSFVVEELKAVFDPRGGAWMGGKYVPSLLAAIGSIIQQHMVDIGFMAGAAPREGDSEPQAIALAQNAPQDGTRRGLPSGIRQCPKCGAAGIIRQEGCDLCTSCGYSKCG